VDKVLIFDGFLERIVLLILRDNTIIKVNTEGMCLISYSSGDFFMFFYVYFNIGS